MPDEITYVFADITKRDKQADGSIMVTGLMSSPTLDLDKQIMDPAFLSRAAPDWFSKRANIREMHQPIAVGKGQSLTTDPNGLLVLTSKIVDPAAVKKVEEGILSAYSVGIKGARVVRDQAAPNGRIVDGTMVEVSLVDYPASEVGKFTIAKAADPDEDTGAIAPTVDELVALDASLTTDPNANVEGDAAARGEAAGEAAKAVSAAGAGASPAASTNLSPADLRAAALAVNPTASQDDLNALLAAYQAICSPNQESEAIDGQGTENNDQNDADAGVTPHPATDAAPSAGGDEDSYTEASKLAPEALAGSLKAALLDDTDTEVRDLIAKAAGVALADTVKAAVEEATKALSDRLQVLEKSAAPSGPYRGAARTFSLDATATQIPGAPARVDPVKARLEKMAASEDPDIRRAGLAVLARDYATP